MRQSAHISLLAMAMLPALAMAGCMGALSNEGPDKLTITPAQYRDTFDAATRTAQQMGYKVVIVDRSNGIIETDTRHAGGALEPWRIDNDGIVEASANTTANRRRRIRFEFVPVGAPIDHVKADSVLHGPAIPGSTRAQDRFDVQTCTGPIEVEVWVYIERSFTEGTKPSSYSGSLSSTWTNQLNVKSADAKDDSTRDNAKWTPVGRDLAYERTIAARIAQNLNLAGDGSEPKSDAAVVVP